mmetsp:Transcript_16096/g.49877  ORF Transcript_16096/g.49877 Transcript_16096/m.49877 type:complete len:219 (+) Transcript_16096:1317-1973(+)
MSSLRNVTKRSTHKERAQPSARKKFGLLEKKSDYKLRSDNYHKRQARLKTLQRKAQERNPDEFAFGMIGTVAGERRGPEGSASTHAATAKLKSEDLRYVRMAKVIDDHRVGRLQGELHGTESAGAAAQHTYFGDEPAARRRATAAPPKKDKRARLAGRKVAKAYAKLDGALEDQRASTELLQRLEGEKIAMGKGRKRKVAGAADGRPAVFKWRKQRAK